MAQCKTITVSGLDPFSVVQGEILTVSSPAPGQITGEARFTHNGSVDKNVSVQADVTVNGNDVNDMDVSEIMSPGSSFSFSFDIQLGSLTKTQDFQVCAEVEGADFTGSTATV